MRDMTWGRFVGQLLEEGIRVVGELEKEFAKQAEQVEQAKTQASQPSPAPFYQAKPASAGNVNEVEKLQLYLVESLRLQGYEVKQDFLPNLIHVHQDGNPVAYVVFTGGQKIIIEPSVTNVQSSVREATALIEELKGELLIALQANCTDEIIMKSALDLTDAYVGETVAKENVESYNKLVQVLTSLLSVPQGTH